MARRSIGGPEIRVELDRMGFGQADLFRDFRLKVAPGEVVALIGPSGVGKTTILRMIAGLETGYQGRVTVDGQPAQAAPVPGMVFQDARLLPWATVAGNLRAVLPDVVEARIEELLVSVGLGGLGPAWPRELSGGMQRRLGLARALLVNPGLLLLDEPFVSLDRAIVRDLSQVFSAAISASGATVLLVSHDPEDAARLADRVVILHGRPVRVTAEIALGQWPRQTRGRIDIAEMAQAIERATEGEVAA